MKNHSLKIERFWLLLLLAIASVYAYYFLILPQSWTLNNDYGWLIAQHLNHEPFWRHALDFTRSELHTGRFHPVWDQWTMFWYHHVPLEPVVFRAIQFGLLGVSCLLIAKVLKELRLTRSQIVFAEVLFLSNFTIKDWITLTAAFEPLATTFFLVSLFFVLRGKRLIAAILFALSFLSKESYFVLFPCLLLLDWHACKRLSWTAVAYFIVPCSAFAWFVHGLPRIYTAHAFGHFGVTEVLRGLTLPPLRNFGPVLLLVGYTFWRNRSLTPEERKTIVLGAVIIVPFSILLAAWGPYDSWLYLHILIPVGWAFALASLWRPDESRGAVALTAIAAAYLLFSVIHGSRNVWNFVTEAKTAAAIACQDHEKDPRLTVYSNCDEGSYELTNYLQAFHVCQNPPTLLWTESHPVFAVPYEIVSSKKCVAFTTQAPVRARLHMWTVYSYSNP